MVRTSGYGPGVPNSNPAIGKVTVEKFKFCGEVGIISIVFTSTMINVYLLFVTLKNFNSSKKFELIFFVYKHPS